MLNLELISPCLTGSTNEVYGSLGVLDLELVNGFLIGSQGQVRFVSFLAGGTGGRSMDEAYEWSQTPVCLFT